MAVDSSPGSGGLPDGGRLLRLMLYGFLAAVRYLPVNTVILIFFLHPVALALVAARLGHERVSGAMLWRSRQHSAG